MLLRLVALFCAILTMPLVGSQSVTLEDIVDLGSGQVLSQFLTLHDLHELCTTNKAYQKIVQKYLNVPYKHPLAIEVPEFNPRWGFSDNPHFSRTLALSSPQIKEKALLQIVLGATVRVGHIANARVASTLDTAILLNGLKDLPSPLTILGVVRETPHVKEGLSRLWAQQIVSASSTRRKVRRSTNRHPLGRNA